MTLKNFGIAWLIFVAFHFMDISYLYPQELDSRKFHPVKDTLITINGALIDQNKVMMTRENMTNTDTLKTNHEGIQVTGFNMNAITLGKEITLHSSSGAITEEMRNEIINGSSKYKFIYIKDIILQTKDGQVASPSMKSFKITFTN
ncbi:MAG TPA: hypothetical protein DCQ26_11930 [Marinilabiliales bacterium]|jgi:hypothetical protein|nr:MAG: hypothetical protein A2W95_02225 [Bacteroidetes bacterium GWA2_40_14]OFX57060.1 MAG: hypothetical protein A2W84_12040 [Bacteroidetes bacterium GWC2_40_13]OFX72186.1 MAG: hypothetical protein A2W96_05760 [Bacteroidetes bacterium GWD2_40_43]OFX94252.1 MAG: hypothetical protein A2W97_18960 [Bacteroidetes bacterium GWE2_40_63]OFY23679.1 MAG: hypothetical protein A2W88_12880 [Bacteroidetes bacterium GWF2_40_13]OFZ25246.1 MAG: hypothetical protein A2437_07645 [Bacteroidetes bacterium RIFOXYC